ncbi:hypothetical protein EDB80DRAFT_833805 [Ilyonectria destructans]|nr:hypothetical protein EDB80DRAFT_833805 [Ilyonectria destructans]
MAALPTSSSRQRYPCVYYSMAYHEPWSIVLVVFDFGRYLNQTVGTELLSVYSMRTCKPYAPVSQNLLCHCLFPDLFLDLTVRLVMDPSQYRNAIPQNHVGQRQNHPIEDQHMTHPPKNLSRRAQKKQRALLLREGGLNQGSVSTGQQRHAPAQTSQLQPAQHQPPQLRLPQHQPSQHQASQHEPSRHEPPQHELSQHELSHHHPSPAFQIAGRPPFQNETGAIALRGARQSFGLVESPHQPMEQIGEAPTDKTANVDVQRWLVGIEERLASRHRTKVHRLERWQAPEGDGQSHPIDPAQMAMQEDGGVPVFN